MISKLSSYRCQVNIGNRIKNIIVVTERGKCDQFLYSKFGFGCRKRMKKNRTSWSDKGAEAMIKVISYIKSNLLEDLITGKMEKAIQKELSERIEETKKVKKAQIGKIKYATKNSILESLTGFRKQKLKELLRNKGFNEMRIVGN